MRSALCVWWLACAACAQSLQVYSEFQRVDPFGEIVAVDRSDPPREILSPAVARNAYASFHLAVSVAEGVPSFLYIQQNPELFRVTVYRERFAKTRRGWIPDALERVSLPYTLILPEAAAPIPHQTTVVFWLDIWVPAGTPPGRMRLQALLKTGDRWLVYPMEVRVSGWQVPALAWKPGPVAAVSLRADASLSQVLCGRRGSPSAALNVRQFIGRNAMQDRLLAKKRNGVPAPQVQDWCADAGLLPAEWYLRVRDALLR